MADNTMKDELFDLETEDEFVGGDEVLDEYDDAEVETDFQENDEDDDGGDALPDEAEVVREVLSQAKGAVSKRASRARTRRTDLSAAVLDGDSVRMYLKEIGRVDLLTAQEEVDLAMKIEAGVAATAQLEAAERGEIELTRTQARRLMRVEQTAIEAKQALASANLRLVVSIAKRYMNRGMNILDLIQEGNLGLIRAVEKFDYTKGFKFSTYATWWIKQSITRAIADQARTIRIPVHMYETVSKLRRTHKQLTQVLGRDPSLEELADAMEMTVERVFEIQMIDQDTISLEKPIGEEEDSSFGDFIKDETVESPFDAAAAKLMHDDIMGALAKLADRERRVLIMRFGLVDGQPHTLEEVGREFGVTRERVRQIESKAFAKLRNQGLSGKLWDV